MSLLPFYVDDGNGTPPLGESFWIAQRTMPHFFDRVRSENCPRHGGTEISRFENMLRW